MNPYKLQKEQLHKKIYDDYFKNKKEEEQRIKRELEQKYKGWVKIREESGPNDYLIEYENPSGTERRVEQKFFPLIYTEESMLGSSYNSFDNIIKTETKIIETDKDELLNYYVPNKGKMKLNIIYYSDSLLKDMETSDYCAYLQMNIKGTFYGCHNMNLLNLICEKIRKSDRDFILINLQPKKYIIKYIIYLTLKNIIFIAITCINILI